MSLKGGAQWSVATAREHLSFEQQDPWAGYWTSRQTPTELTPELKDAIRACMLDTTCN